MPSLDDIANTQIATAKAIYSLYENFNKERSVRRTVENTKMYEQNLAELWDKFSDGHKQAEVLMAENPQHHYFVKRYFSQVKDMLDKFTEKIKQRLDGTEATGPETSKSSTIEVAPSSASAADEEQARRIRQQLATIKALENMLDAIEQDQAFQKTRSYLTIRSKAISDYWSDIARGHKEIMACSNQYDYNPVVYFLLEERYQGVKISLEESLESNSLPVQCRLPKIEIPTFDGSYLKWKQFQDLFTQMIHNQPIGAAQKMFYLKANLSGEPSKLIRHLQATDDNYQVAWKLIVDRYDNKRSLLSSLLVELLTQPALTTESSNGVKRLHDTSKECLLAIDNLGIDTTSWDPIILHMLLQKLDKDSRRLYEQSITNPREVQSLANLFTFLDTRFHQLETVPSRDDKKKTSTFIAAAHEGCPVCKSNDHKIYGCAKFLKQIPADRIQTARRLQLCANCLRSNHKVDDCTSKSCSKCNLRHNTLLHKASSNQKPNEVRKSSKPNHKNTVQGTNQALATENKNNHQPSSDSSSSSLNATSESQVMLATAVVNVVNFSGVAIRCRVLLDSGSQLHFISEKMTNELGLQRERIKTSIGAIGGLETIARHKTYVTITSRASNFTATIEAVILPKIGEMQPSQFVDTKGWSVPSYIELADPAFFKPQAIDMLIGAELYFSILKGEQLRLLDNQPILQNTELGWVVSGKMKASSDARKHCYIVTQPSFTSLEQQVKKFWEMEQHQAPTKQLSEEEAECEEHFQKTFRRLPNGQFVVRLPLRKDPANLGSSLQIASKRFQSLERKLEKNPALRQAYREFLLEYKNLGHMEQIQHDELAAEHFFLPHHAVIKPDSSTTKLRVVFDGSAKTTSGCSLNDILAVGPCVQPELFSIVTRFRLHRYVFTADISKMYRQIKVDERDQQLQLILWRDAAHEQFRYYKLNTVTYGTSSAPFLATRCLNQLALAEEDFHPLASRVLQADTYVDDILTGSETIEGAKNLKKQLIKLLKRGNFELRKFCSNHPDIIEDIPLEHREKMLMINETEAVKTLGMAWQPNEDVFQPYITLDDSPKFTKRAALSDVARLFDPLGLIAPVVILGKLFIQELWKANLSWDEEMPTALQAQWVRFRSYLLDVKHIKIPRKVLLPSPREIQIHAFSDSSKLAFGTCIYLRSTDSFGQILVRLLCAKSRTVPLKEPTIPRLELCAAVLMVELVERLLQFLPIEIKRILYYTDSTTTLSWIAKPSYTWKTFVAHRVDKIQTLTTKEQWRHIEGTQNPADLVSRGVLPKTLAHSPLWFNGPAFLQETEDKWPSGAFQGSTEDLEERVLKQAYLSLKPGHQDIISKVNHKNSFAKLQRIIGYCLRFTNNCKVPKSIRTMGTLSINELDMALYSIIKNVQRTSFMREYHSLQHGEVLEGSNPILTLSPFLEESSGIIRVGGRVRHSEREEDAKHQILLPKNNAFTKLLMRFLHISHMHAGPQTLLAIMRQRYWPMDGKRLAQTIVHECIRCFRCKPRSIDQVMGDLPKERVQPKRPFYTTGIDFCGPFYVHYKIRGKTPTKAYIAVFVCFVTKAVHLELVSDLTTEAFINALRRFISRRGLCHTIFCDNGTNFVGARSELSELRESFKAQGSQQQIQEICHQNHIEWKPIPPRSPHFGGLWEAAVKSAKYHLVRQVGNASLTHEEMGTVIAQIEAILNSRPLTPMSSDPSDLEALTPGHFLVGHPLTSFAEPDLSQENFNRLARYQRLQHIQQNFWKRWSAEYLNQLQTKTKWTRSKANIKPGTMVLLKEQNTNPLNWPLGRVINTIEGPDKQTRVVQIKTATNVLKRSIHNICPLPIDEEVPTVKKGSTNQVAPTSMHISQEQARTSGTMQPAKTSRWSRFLPINPNWLKAKENEPSTECSSPKQARTTSGGISGLVSFLLCVALVLPTHGETLKVSTFENHPGIYYEELGELDIVQNNWNLIIYYNLTNYWHEINQLERSLAHINLICGYLSEHPKNYCSTISEQLKHEVKVLKDYNTILKSNREDLAEKRKKRSPLDIVGTLGNKLFGLLDANYAKDLEQTIDQLKSTEIDTRHLVAKQASVIDSTLNVIKRNEEQTNKNFKMVESVMQNILLEYKRDHKNVQEDRLTQLFTTLSVHASLIITNYQKVQNALLDITLDVHHGKISPLLLTPVQLRNELQLIREYLPENTAIPLQRGEINYSRLYTLLTAQARITENKAIFLVNIPLINNERFKIYEIISLPIPVGNSTRFIKTSAQFLGTNLHGDKFTTLSSHDLSHCKNPVPGKYLCSVPQPLATRAVNNHNCEIGLFKPANNIIPANCEWYTANITEWWKQLHAKNQWIYWLRDQATLTLVCSSNTSQLSLQGQGVLEFKNKCTLKHNSIILSTHQEYSNNMMGSYIPTRDMVPVVELPKWDNTTIALHQASTNDKEIKTLKATLSKIQHRAESASTTDNHNLHHYVVNYTNLSIMSILLLGLLFYYRCKNKTHQIASSNHTPRAEEFQLHPI